MECYSFSEVVWESASSKINKQKIQFGYSPPMLWIQLLIRPYVQLSGADRILCKRWSLIVDTSRKFCLFLFFKLGLKPNWSKSMIKSKLVSLVGLWARMCKVVLPFLDWADRFASTAKTSMLGTFFICSRTAWKISASQRSIQLGNKSLEPSVKKKKDMFVSKY